MLSPAPAGSLSVKSAYTISLAPTFSNSLGMGPTRAVVEQLHARPERAAKTLFATHYHEMTALATMLPRVR